MKLPPLTVGVGLDPARMRPLFEPVTVISPKLACRNVAEGDLRSAAAPPGSRDRIDVDLPRGSDAARRRTTGKQYYGKRGSQRQYR